MTRRKMSESSKIRLSRVLWRSAIKIGELTERIAEHPEAAPVAPRLIAEWARFHRLHDMKTSQEGRAK